MDKFETGDLFLTGFISDECFVYRRVAHPKRLSVSNMNPANKINTMYNPRSLQVLKASFTVPVTVLISSSGTSSKSSSCICRSSLSGNKNIAYIVTLSYLLLNQKFTWNATYLAVSCSASKIIETLPGVNRGIRAYRGHDLDHGCFTDICCRPLGLKFGILVIF